MARKRFITSEMSNDEDIVDIAETDCMLALMWPWFLTGMDDWGRMEVTSPKQVKLDIFKAMPINTASVQAAITAYTDRGLVYQYEVEGRKYIAIEPCKYYSYQTYIRDKKRGEDSSNYPAPINPPWVNCAKCRASARICIPSPSPSPSPSIERDYKEELQKISDKSFAFGMNGISNEFLEDCELRLKEGTEAELIIKALSIAASKASGHNKCRYAISILQSWAADGIKAIEQLSTKEGGKKGGPTGDSKPAPAYDTTKFIYKGSTNGDIPKGI